MMERENDIKLFGEQKISSHRDETDEKCFFSIVDVEEILSDSPKSNYNGTVLTNRLKKVNSLFHTNCNQLAIQSTDVKYYKTDLAETEQLSHFLKSITSSTMNPKDSNVYRIDNKNLHTTPLGSNILWSHGFYKHAIPMGLTNIKIQKIVR